MIMMLKRHLHRGWRWGKGGWGKGVQSVHVIDLSWRDTDGRSQQHTCMILMGGQAAGHPHLWETDPAVRPLTEQAERDGTHLAWRPMLWLRAVFIKMHVGQHKCLASPLMQKVKSFCFFTLFTNEGKMYFWNALAIQVQKSSAFKG